VGFCGSTEKSDGTKIALNQQTIIHSSTEVETLIITDGQIILYTRESSMVKKAEFVSDRIHT
jgi:hypothetical protein